MHWCDNEHCLQYRTTSVLCNPTFWFGSLFLLPQSLPHISISTFCHIQTNPTLFVLLPRFMTYVPCDSSNGNVLHTCRASQIYLRSHWQSIILFNLVFVFLVLLLICRLAFYGRDFIVSRSFGSLGSSLIMKALNLFGCVYDARTITCIIYILLCYIYGISECCLFICSFHPFIHFI